MCVCVCVCVSARARVCVCVCANCFALFVCLTDLAFMLSYLLDHLSFFVFVV